MKKFFFTFAVAVLALASCSNDETVAVNNSSGEISFRPLNNGMTRAVDQNFTQATNNATFSVTAFQTGAETSKYFGPLTFTSNGSAFVSADKKYWPKTYNLDFYAYAPIADGTQIQLVDGNGTEDANSYKIFKVTPSTTVAEQVDLVYAVTKGWGTYTGYAHSGAAGVTINFRHAESKVLIQLKNSNGSLKFTVGNVTIGNLRGSEIFEWHGVTNGSTTTAASDANTDGQYSTGTLTYLNGFWSTGSGQTSVYTTPAMETTSSHNLFDGTVSSARTLYQNVANAKNYDMILIPQTLNNQTGYSGTTAADPSTHTGGSGFTGAYISVQLKIQNRSNDDYLAGTADNYVTAMWPLNADIWLPGHKYTYTVDLGGGGYYDNNQKNTGTSLDPILDGTEIKFVTVTVDGWTDTPGINVP